MNIRKNDFLMDASQGIPLQGIQLNKVMRNVYAWMTMGLLMTAFVSLLINTSGLVPSGTVMLLAVFGQLGIVIGLSWAIHRISATMAGMLFFAYSAMTGLTFSIIFMIYPIGSITAAFFTTAGVFAAMTVVGLTTQTDLSKYSAYFMMALIGLVIAIVVNIFLNSSGLDFAISIFGVLLFTGLTAWDTQRIARMAADPRFSANADDSFKFSILGALTLYLDFINLFLFLLRLFGGRD